MEETPAVGRWREPVIPGLFHVEDQIRWARNRPHSDRPAKPVPGQIVGLRISPAGVIVRARVIEVRDSPPSAAAVALSQLDWNVWRWVVKDPTTGPELDPHTGARRVELVDDPWWDCLVETMEGPKMRVEVREARLPGSPGWLSWKD